MPLSECKNCIHYELCGMLGSYNRSSKSCPDFEPKED